MVETRMKSIFGDKRRIDEHVNTFPPSSRVIHYDSLTGSIVKKLSHTVFLTEPHSPPPHPRLDSTLYY